MDRELIVMIEDFITFTALESSNLRLWLTEHWWLFSSMFSNVDVEKQHGMESSLTKVAVELERGCTNTMMVIYVDI